MAGDEAAVQLARAFVAELAAALPGSLTAAAVFGSAARGEWIQGISDINVLVLVTTIDGRLLAAASPVCRRAAERGVLPLIMAAAEWERARDVFGIELADMRDAHVPILGDDVAADVRVDSTELRLQAEREIRTKLLHLHGSLLMAAPEPALVAELLRRALSSFATYLRVALRLAGRAVPRGTDEVIRAGCALVGARPEPFLEVYQRRGQAGWAAPIEDPLVDGFNAAAERLADYIDRIGGGRE